jgi:membrane-associated phospholipid phosphatase
MILFVKDNKYFFAWLAIFIIAGGALLLFFDKSEAILFFSRHRSTAGNFIFTYGTKLGEEIAYIVAGLIFLFVRLRNTLLIALTGGVVTLLSFLLKKFFAEDRPFTYFQLNGISDQINFVDGVHLHTGASSFPSGHSMGAFALYALMAFFLPKTKRWATLLFFLALTVAVSRVYLVQHFWQDAYTGSLIGVFIAACIYGLSSKMTQGENHWLNKPAFPVRGFGKRKA